MRRYQLIPSHAVQTLLITSVSPLPSGEIGAPYSFTFNAIGGVAPYSWSEVGAIPSGLTFSGGTLSGTPTGTFSSSFNVTVMDSIGSQFTKSFSVTIITAVQITTSSPLPNATVGAAYSDTIAATGGSTPYVWSILSQTGANTWNLNSSNGVLSGTPGVAELDSILIQVVDALGIPTSKNFNLTVSNLPVVATPTFAPVAGTYGTAQSVVISCTTPSSTIYYTTDGSTPTFPITGTTQQYTSALTVSTSETIKAIGTASGFTNSSVGSAVYTIGGTVFNFFVSPTGSDSNSGTSTASPWAITSLTSVSHNANNVANWNSTAGKNIGLMPGTYDVSGMMPPGTGGQEMAGALYLKAGTSGSAITYWGSCDSSGNESPRSATIDARGSSKLYAGAIQSTGSGEPAVILHGSSGTGAGWATISGIRLTGWCYKGIRIGGKSSADGVTITNPVLVQNCELFSGGFNQVGMVMAWALAGGSGYVDGTYSNVLMTGGSGSNATFTLTVSGGVVVSAVNVNAGQSFVTTNVLTTSNANLGGSGSGFSLTLTQVGSSANQNDNCVAIWLDASTNCVTCSNNWIHDSSAHIYGSGDHLNGIIVWGFGSICRGTTIQYNTLTNCGNIYGKEGGVEGTVVQYNYLDNSTVTANSAGYQAFDGNGQSVSGLTDTSIFRNNVLLMRGNTSGGFAGIGGPTIGDNVGWQTPVQIYNNTIIGIGSTGLTVAWMACDNSSNGVAALQYYNNLYTTSGSGSLNGWGNYIVSPQTIGVQDYNLNPSSGVTWTQYPNSGFTNTGSGGLPSALGSQTSYSAYASALATNGGISGAEAHSITGAPTFVGIGSYAARYQLQGGSLGKGTGSTNGTSGGSPTDMGAWGNGATQVGCNFAI